MLEPPEGVNFRFGACVTACGRVFVQEGGRRFGLGRERGHGNERARLNGEGGDEITYHHRRTRTERGKTAIPTTILDIACMQSRENAEQRRPSLARTIFSANQTEKGNTVRQSNRARGNFRCGQSHAFLPRVKLTASFLGHFGLGWLIGNDKANPNRCFELFKWS